MTSRATRPRTPSLARQVGMQYLPILGWLKKAQTQLKGFGKMGFGVSSIAASKTHTCTHTRAQTQTHDVRKQVTAWLEKNWRGQRDTPEPLARGRFYVYIYIYIYVYIYIYTHIYIYTFLRGTKGSTPFVFDQVAHGPAPLFS